MCIYIKAFVFKPMSNQLNSLLGYNLSFTSSLNTFFLEMDGYFIDWTPRKISPSLSIVNLACCKFIALRENTLSHSSGCSLWEDQDFSLRERLRGSPVMPKILNFPLLLDVKGQLIFHFLMLKLSMIYYLKLCQLCKLWKPCKVTCHSCQIYET